MSQMIANLIPAAVWATTWMKILNSRMQVAMLPVLQVLANMLAQAVLQPVLCAGPCLLHHRHHHSHRLLLRPSLVELWCVPYAQAEPFRRVEALCGTSLPCIPGSLFQRAPLMFCAALTGLYAPRFSVEASTELACINATVVAGLLTYARCKQAMSCLALGLRQPCPAMRLLQRRRPVRQ